MTRDAIDRYLTSSLSVLALHQPHAALLVAPDPHHDGKPGKEHETRSWQPRTPTPFCVAVHAAKKFDADVKANIAHYPIRDALKRCGFFPGDPRPFLDRRITAPSGLKPLQLGAIIGVATVVESYPTDAQGWASPDDFEFGDWSKGRFAWHCADTIMLPKPVPHSGRQEALYPLDVESLEVIHAQLRAMRGAA